MPEVQTLLDKIAGLNERQRRQVENYVDYVATGLTRRERRDEDWKQFLAMLEAQRAAAATTRKEDP